MVRIRNDFGGFWGSGVSFDIRQLYVKGLINQSVRYQIGDINYKLSPYTFYNSDEELSQHQLEGLKIFQDLLHYDLFYNDDNTWRQQGVAVDFALEFDKFAEELEFNVFASRNRPSDFQQQSDRIFFGGNAHLKQSSSVELGVNYIDLMDLGGTSQSTTEFHNPVITGTTQFSLEKGNWDFKFNSESGISEMYELNSGNNVLRDYFMDFGLTATSTKQGLSTKVQYINVGPQFRSIGAQTKRINFGALNQLFGRYGSSQNVRSINQLDMAQDAAIYNFQFNSTLDEYSPIYDNISPYGQATPNRKGLVVMVNKSDSKERFNVAIAYSGLSEVVGQGGDDKRTFQKVDADFLLHIDKFLKGYKQGLELSVGFDQGVTTRTTDIVAANIDLKTTIIDLGLKAGLHKNFEAIFNLRQITASGNELIPVRDLNTEVSDFQEFSTDLLESMILLGVRYNFTEQNTLNVLWQKMTWDDKMTTNPAFGLSQFAVVYNLTF